jgi:hypothetical protein
MDTLTIMNIVGLKLQKKKLRMMNCNIEIILLDILNIQFP